MLIKVFVLLVTITLVTAHCTEDCAPYNPVCGTDGITYPNLIEFQWVLDTQYGQDINLELVGVGACTYKFHKTCLCCLDYPDSKVCGSDNITYRNLCHLNCTSRSNYGKLINLVLQYRGTCGDVNNYPGA